MPDEDLRARVVELEQWVHDLQSGMFINCVYCGHRYGPQDEIPATMADALKEHIEQCPKHPMSALKKELDQIRRLLWLRHGCPLSVLYGDDGEMQCSNCSIDFKRFPVHLIDIGFRILSAKLSEGAREDSQAPR